MFKTESESAYRAQLTQLCTAINNGRSDLACYQQNFLGGHRQALEKSFPFTRQLLGEPVFLALANAYVKNYPSVHWDINRYGEALSQLLAAQCQSARADDYDWNLMSAVALVEHSISQLYYSPPNTTLPIQLLPPHCAALAISSTEKFTKGLVTCHRYVDVSPTISLAQTLVLRWQGLRILLTNSAVERLSESDYV